jgi:hypothetical protein
MMKNNTFVVFRMGQHFKHRKNIITVLSVNYDKKGNQKSIDVYVQKGHKRKLDKTMFNIPIKNIRRRIKSGKTIFVEYDGL